MRIDFSPSERTSLGAVAAANGGELRPVVDLLLAEMRDGVSL